MTESDGRDIAVLTADRIDISAVIDAVRDDGAGAISTFIGTTRNTFEGKIVVSLEYEAYEDMAVSEMRSICCKIRARWDVKHIAIYHKTGSCPVGETSVVIAVSSAHRVEGIEAAHFAIDELKRTVPVWKKEVYAEGGAAWKENTDQSIPRGVHSLH